MLSIPFCGFVLNIFIMDLVDNSIKYMSFNAQSICNKKFEFFHYLKSNAIRIAFVQETHLSYLDSCSDPDYSFIRLDRDDGRRGGGVGLAVWRGLRFRVIPCPPTRVIEAVGVEILTPIGWIPWLSAYFPGAVGPDSLADFEHDVRLLFSTHSRFMIAGDWNARHSFWGCSSSNATGEILFRLLMGSLVDIHFPPDPTHYPHDGSTPSTLDFIITKGVGVLNCPWTDDALASDHLTVVGEVDLQPVGVELSPPVVKDYRNANWVGFSALVTARLSRSSMNLDSESGIDSAIQEFNQIVLEADAAFVPSRVAAHKGTKLTPEIINLIRLRRRFRRNWQRSRDVGYRIEMRRITRLIDSKTKALVNARFSKSVGKINSDPGPHRQQFWKLVKNLKSRPRPMPALRVAGRRLLTDGEKATALADQFMENQSSASVNSNRSSHASMVSRTVSEVDDYQISSGSFTAISTEEISLEIARLRGRKAPGPDGIMNEHIKHLPSSAVNRLKDILNACMDAGYFPTTWKVAKVKCIPKPGKPPTSPANYRMISLLSNISKLYEVMILNRLRPMVEDLDIIPSNQFGFVQGKSCTHQLLRTIRFIRRETVSRKSVGMLCLDLKSAFDVVWHDGLIHKLRTLGISLHIVKLIRSFLDGRVYSVNVGNLSSDLRPISAGVPQGSVMAPMLFNVYISDLPVVGDLQSQFADDQAILISSHKTAAIKNKLQQSARRMSRYFRKWRICVNGAKSELVLFTKKTAARHRPSAPVQVDGADIGWSSSLKYLGMKLDKRLTFRDHVDFICTKLDKVIKSLYPLICRNSRLNLKNKVLLFKTVYRPTICYAAPGWKHCAKAHRLRLQRMQNRFLKIALGMPRRTSTALVHRLTGVEYLEDYLDNQENRFLGKCRNSIHVDIASLVDR